MITGGFRLAFRRQQQRADSQGSRMYDDYATEVTKSDLDIQLSNLLTISALVLGIGITMVASVNRSEMQSGLDADSARHARNFNYAHWLILTTYMGIGFACYALVITLMILFATMLSGVLSEKDNRGSLLMQKYRAPLITCYIALFLAVVFLAVATAHLYQLKTDTVRIKKAVTIIGFVWWAVLAGAVVWVLIILIRTRAAFKAAAVVEKWKQSAATAVHPQPATPTSGGKPSITAAAGCCSCQQQSSSSPAISDFKQ